MLQDRDRLVVIHDRDLGRSRQQRAPLTSNRNSTTGDILADLPYTYTVN